MNETFICQVYAQQILGIDDFRCGLMNFAATLYAFNLGYICLGLQILIILLSIFGGIKESYRWFILNQAFWDIFWCIENSCNNPMEKYVKRNSTIKCFHYIGFWIEEDDFYYDSILYKIDLFTRDFVVNNYYTSLVLVTVSRVFALYFINLYKKLTQNQRVLCTILIFNLIVILLNFTFFFDFFAEKRSEELLEKCQIRENGTYISDDCYYYKSCLFCKTETKTDILYKVLNFISTWLGYFWYVKSSLFIFISTVATVMITAKILKQSIFQIKHNKNDFYKSLRISGVIILQTCLNIFIFSIEINEVLKSFFYDLGILYLDNNVSDEVAKKYPNYIDLRVVPWFSTNYGLSSPQSFQMIIQIRVLMESLLVLFVMTGYRESLVLCTKIIFFKIRYPRKSHKEIMSRINQTVTKVSSFNK